VGQVNPNDAYARSVLALCLAKSGRTAEGQAEMRRALELDPTNSAVLYKAAVIAVIQGNHDGAVSWIERAVAGGYPTEDLLRDPELSSIQSLPSFRSAVKSGV
jgi:Flp pilus assembly protein TadD